MEGSGGSLLFLVLMGAVFYFMIYRPNRRMRQHHRSLIESVQEGDEVVTAGGLLGTVRAVTEDEFHLELAPGTTVRLAKPYVARRLEPEDAEEESGEIEPARDPGA